LLKFAFLAVEFSQKKFKFHRVVYMHSGEVENIYGKYIQDYMYKIVSESAGFL